MIMQNITTNVIAVNLGLPVTSVQGLIDNARANPGKLFFGSSGTGGSQHLAMELFKNMTGTRLVHVPYKGIQQAITDAIGGQVHIVCDNMSSIRPHIVAGRLPRIARRLGAGRDQAGDRARPQRARRGGDVRGRT